MSDSPRQGFSLPPEQQAIRDAYFHPSGTFLALPKEQIEQSIPARFETVFRRFPDRLAVSMGDVSLTYAQLHQAADRVSRNVLDTLGGEQEAVEVPLSQGVFLVAALRGRLKAGKFHVPLDPSYPLRTDKFVFEDSGTKLIATDGANLSLAQEPSNAALRVLDCEDPEPGNVDEDPPDPVSPTDLAWPSYTSGTTGEPKG